MMKNVSPFSEQHDPKNDAYANGNYYDYEPRYDSPEDIKFRARVWRWVIAAIAAFWVGGCWIVIKFLL